MTLILHSLTLYLSKWRRCEIYTNLFGNVRSIAMSYINTTIPCYYSELNSNVYLNKNDDLPALIGYSTGLGVVVIIIIIIHRLSKEY